MGVSREQGEKQERRRAESWGITGSVSIYFIVATAAFVLLTALLIDFARIAAFRKQAELAVKSGVRSVLSSYDPVIYARYGLFIRGGDPANQLFLETLQGNASTQDGEGAFTFLDTQWGETDVTESRPLADHDVFRRQILEEMKYKAPIDLTLELAQRFRGMSGVMKEASTTVDVLEKMRKAYDRRESALDEALAIQRRIGEEFRRSLASEIPYPPRDLQTNQAAGVVHTIVDAAVQYEDYVSKRREDEARREAQRLKEEINKRKGADTETDTEAASQTDEKDGPLYEAVVAAYESGTVTLASELNLRSAHLLTLNGEAGQEAHAAYLKAKEANDEMRIIVEQAKSMPPLSYDTDATDSGSSTVGSENVQTLKQIRETADELVLEERFFEQYEAEISLQQSQGLLLANEVAAFSSLVSSVPGSTGRGQTLRTGAASLQNSYSEYVRNYGPDGSICSDRASALQAHRSFDQARKQEEEKAKLAWAGARNFLGSLTGVSGSEEEKAGFTQVNGLYHSNSEWNKAEREAEAQVEAVNDPSEGRDEALSMSNGLMDILQGSLIGTRDELYFSEYAISRFSHYDPSSVKVMLNGGDAPLAIDLQETEYVLYGLNNPSANIAAAYSEIFAFRLAIRTMEGLVECRAMGHPLLVLAAALAYGIRNALLDLNLLVERGTVQLSKWIKVDTVYTDYLRLFLLAHGGSANQTARMIAVIEQASGVSFSGAYTYASGEGKASLKLWFFPGLLKVMGRYGNLGGTVKGNRYEAAFVADSSYQ